METKLLSELLKVNPAPEKSLILSRLSVAQEENHAKIVVLDDDPTGVQTVHDVNVYTDWSFESIRAFKRKAPLLDVHFRDTAG